jgi:acyl carrier protein
MATAAPEAIDARVRTVIARAFQLSAADAQGDLRMGGLPQWDSMGHMMLVMELEREFGVTFPSFELAELQTIDTIVAALGRQGVR